MPTADKTIDCIGLFCPMPIIKTKEVLDNMKPGETLEVVSDDPGFENDLPSWCKATGNEFAGLVKDAPLIRGYVKKK